MAQHVASPITFRDEHEMQSVPRSSAQNFKSQSRHSIGDETMSGYAEKAMLQSSENSPEPSDNPISSTLYSSEEEQTVLRKFDRHLVLFIALLYMLGFLDRSST